MRKRSLKPILSVGLLLLVGGSAHAQDVPVSPPADEQPQNPEQIERAKREEAALVGHLLDEMFARINPAYRPLFPVIREITQGTLAYDKVAELKFPKDIFSSPLSEVKTFVAQVPIKTSLNIAGVWIRNFHGIDPVFAASNKEEKVDENSVILLPVSAALTAMWGATERIHFAEGHNDLAFEQLEERLRFAEIMGETDFTVKLQADDTLKGSPAFFAQHLSAFTPHQCVRLLGIIEHWKASTEVSDALLTKAMHEDQESLMQEVLNDGTVPDREAEARQATEMERKLDAGELIPEEPAFELPVPAPLPPTPQAREKRKQVADAVAEDFIRLRTRLRDPFAVLPPKPARPKWLEGIVSEDYNGYGETQLQERKQMRIRLQLLDAHLLIRRFRWEHDRLPRTLSELQNPKRMTDPVTGKFFNYKTDGETYTLTSAGVSGFEKDGEGKPLPAKPYDLMTVVLTSPEFMPESDVAVPIDTREGSVRP